MATRIAHPPLAKSAAAQAPARPSPDRGEWLVILLIVVATLTVFWPVCMHDFVDWDDYANVARNPHLNPPTWGAVEEFWTHPYLDMYIPLTYTAWAGLATLAKTSSPDAAGVRLDPYVFHAANLLLHLIAALLAYQLLKALTGRRWPACAGALLFALHPVQVEPVAWVTGMKDVLCGALSIAALWQYVLYADRRDPPAGANPLGRSCAGHYAAATLLLGLALLAKPSAMTVPLLAILLDRFVLGRSWRRIAVALLPWCALAGACAVEAALAQRAGASDAGPMALRPLVAADALAFYLWKIAFPARLGILYHFSPRAVLASRWAQVVWLAPACVAAVVWVYRKKFPWMIAAAGIFLAAVLPVLGLVPFYFERFSLVADRYLYVAMLGPALALAFVLTHIRWRKTAAVACGLWLALLGARSYAQTWQWSDSTTLFRHALTVNPHSAVAYNNLAVEAMNAQRPDEAQTLARASVRLDPHQADAYTTLGAALQRLGKTAAADAAYAKAYDNDPSNALALSDYSAVLTRRGQWTQAARLNQRAIELAPNFASPHHNLAAIYSYQSKIPQAITEARIAARLDPFDAEAQITLGKLLARAGQTAEAVEHFQLALKLDPSSTFASQAIVKLTSGNPAPRRR